MKKNFLLLSILIVWIIFALIDSSALLLIDKKTYAQNIWTLADSHIDPATPDFIPFIPLFHDQGFSYGDLLNGLFFTPRATDIRPQTISIDEYGFRNYPGAASQKIDAVIFGTSVVGGASSTQSDLISELLNRDHIRTYNYATAPLQEFWNDSRFLSAPPKFVILIGKDNEILNEPKITLLQKSPKIIHLKAWQSPAQWSRSQSHLPSYSQLNNYVKNYSLTRYSTNLLFSRLLNTLLTRSQINRLLLKNQYVYEDESGMIFLAPSGEPRTATEVKNNISNSIARYKNIQKILLTRKIQLIVVVVPSKASLYAQNFKNIPLNERISVRLEQEMAKARINHLAISATIFSQARTQKLYYPDDSHWNTLMNKLIAKNLTNYIRNLQHSSHKP